METVKSVLPLYGMRGAERKDARHGFPVSGQSGTLHFLRLKKVLSAAFFLPAIKDGQQKTCQNRNLTSEKSGRFQSLRNFFCDGQGTQTVADASRIVKKLKP